MVFDWHEYFGFFLDQFHRKSYPNKEFLQALKDDKLVYIKHDCSSIFFFYQEILFVYHKSVFTYPSEKMVIDMSFK